MERNECLFCWWVWFWAHSINTNGQLSASEWQNILAKGKTSDRTSWLKGRWAATENPLQWEPWLGQVCVDISQSALLIPWSGLWMWCAQPSIPPSRKPFTILAGSSFPVCFANWKFQQGSAVPALPSLQPCRKSFLHLPLEDGFKS